MPGSRGKVARVLLGSYEREHTALFQRWVRPGDTVVDAGAHAGYYSLLASVLAGPTGAVWSFEPNPENASSLRQHVQINRCRNVHVEDSALSDTAGTAHFQLGRGSATGRLVESGGFEVRTVTLDEICEGRQLVPAVIKIDVEGAEARVLAGAAATLRKYAPVVFLSTHGDAMREECLSLLESLSYRFEPIGAASIGAASEILAVSPEGRGSSR